MGILEGILGIQRQQQAQEINQLNMQRQQQMLPIQMQLQKLEAKRQEQQLGLGEQQFGLGQQQQQLNAQKLEQADAQQVKEQTMLAGRLAEQALNIEDPEIRSTFIQGAAQKLGVQDEFDPTSVTDEDLMQLIAAKQSLEPRDAEAFQQAKGDGLEGYVFNPNTGRYTIDEKLRGRINKTKLLAEKPSLNIKDISSINKDLTALTKDAREIKAAADSIAGLEESSSAAAKLAAVFKFMKALDPTSVVRETEQGQVYDSQGIPEGLLGRINSLTGEGRLTGRAFSDLVNTAKVMANSAIESARDESRSFLDVFTELDDNRRASLERRVPRPFSVKAIEEPEEPAQSLGTSRGRGRNKRAAPVSEFDQDLLEFMTPEERSLFK